MNQIARPHGSRPPQSIGAMEYTLLEPSILLADVVAVPASPADPCARAWCWAEVLAVVVAPIVNASSPKTLANFFTIALILSLLYRRNQFSYSIAYFFSHSRKDFWLFGRIVELPILKYFARHPFWGEIYTTTT